HSPSDSLVTQVTAILGSAPLFLNTGANTHRMEWLRERVVDYHKGKGKQAHSLLSRAEDKRILRSEVPIARVLTPFALCGIVLLLPILFPAWFPVILRPGSPAYRCLGVLVLAVGLWANEGMPLHVTAILICVMAVVMRLFDTTETKFTATHSVHTSMHGTPLLPLLNRDHPSLTFNEYHEGDTTLTASLSADAYHTVLEELVSLSSEHQHQFGVSLPGAKYAVVDASRLSLSGPRSAPILSMPCVPTDMFSVLQDLHVVARATPLKGLVPDIDVSAGAHGVWSVNYDYDNQAPIYQPVFDDFETVFGDALIGSISFPNNFGWLYAGVEFELDLSGISLFHPVPNVDHMRLVVTAAYDVSLSYQVDIELLEEVEFRVEVPVIDLDAMWGLPIVGDALDFSLELSASMDAFASIDFEEMEFKQEFEYISSGNYTWGVDYTESAGFVDISDSTQPISTTYMSTPEYALSFVARAGTDLSLGFSFLGFGVELKPTASVELHVDVTEGACKDGCLEYSTDFAVDVEFDIPEAKLLGVVEIPGLPYSYGPERVLEISLPCSLCSGCLGDQDFSDWKTESDLVLPYRNRFTAFNYDFTMTQHHFDDDTSWYPTTIVTDCDDQSFTNECTIVKIYEDTTDLAFGDVSTYTWLAQDTCKFKVQLYESIAYWQDPEYTYFPTTAVNDLCTREQGTCRKVVPTVHDGNHIDITIDFSWWPEVLTGQFSGPLTSNGGADSLVLVQAVPWAQYMVSLPIEGVTQTLFLPDAGLASGLASDILEDRDSVMIPVVEHDRVRMQVTSFHDPNNDGFGSDPEPYMTPYMWQSGHPFRGGYYWRRIQCTDSGHTCKYKHFDKQKGPGDFYFSVYGLDGGIADIYPQYEFIAGEEDEEDDDYYGTMVIDRANVQEAFDNPDKSHLYTYKASSDHDVTGNFLFSAMDSSYQYGIRLAHGTGDLGLEAESDPVSVGFFPLQTVTDIDPTVCASVTLGTEEYPLYGQALVEISLSAVSEGTLFYLDNPTTTASLSLQLEIGLSTVTNGAVTYAKGGSKAAPECVVAAQYSEPLPVGFASGDRVGLAVTGLADSVAECFGGEAPSGAVLRLWARVPADEDGTSTDPETADKFVGSLRICNYSSHGSQHDVGRTAQFFRTLPSTTGEFRLIGTEADVGTPTSTYYCDSSEQDLTLPHTTTSSTGVLIESGTSSSSTPCPGVTLADSGLSSVLSTERGSPVLSPSLPVPHFSLSAPDSLPVGLAGGTVSVSFEEEWIGDPSIDVVVSVDGIAESDGSDTLSDDRVFDVYSVDAATSALTLLASDVAYYAHNATDVLYASETAEKVVVSPTYHVSTHISLPVYPSSTTLTTPYQTLLCANVDSTRFYSAAYAMSVPALVVSTSPSLGGGEGDTLRVTLCDTGSAERERERCVSVVGTPALLYLSDTTLDWDRVYIEFQYPGADVSDWQGTAYLALKDMAE
ncbi:hypothetical protein KIPB_003123, partial [Kipferlia bialata]